METKQLIIFLDCGDTIINEETEIRNEEEVVIQAELIPGAGEMVKTLAERGYRLALVADGLAQSFKNMLTDHQLYDYFEVMIYSENMKTRKPDERMFKAALGAMNLSETDCERIMMVGNNLARDIKGANAMGMLSVFLQWSPRYPKTPAEEAETPDYTISTPLELLEIVEQVNEGLTRKSQHPVQ
ncbi:HAD family hydrolase [Alkalihalobacterium bogoriense]|uniref:HAD family hydrolase n=1 Tax=Alkalihalobacterium bogoriense TaxID=246272 RepID=UPI000688A211|nr:HAD family hydrolase [Alkalihalobacterium bogoriense]